MPSQLPWFRRRTPLPLHLIQKKADWIKILTRMEIATWERLCKHTPLLAEKKSVCSSHFTSICFKNSYRHVELLQSAGQVCKYTNLGYNQRTHASPGNLSKQASMAEGKTGAKPNKPRRDEKWEAFRLSRTSAPQRLSQAHPKVCIYFHSPSLTSSHLLPLTHRASQKRQCVRDLISQTFHRRSSVVRSASAHILGWTLQKSNGQYAGGRQTSCIRRPAVIRQGPF